MLVYSMSFQQNFPKWSKEESPFVDKEFSNFSFDLFQWKLIYRLIENFCVIMSMYKLQLLWTFLSKGERFCIRWNEKVWKVEYIKFKRFCKVIEEFPNEFHWKIEEKGKIGQALSIKPSRNHFPVVFLLSEPFTI